MVFTPLIAMKKNEIFSSGEESRQVFAQQNQKLPDSIKVYRTQSGKTQKVSLEEYTVLSVCAEISPDFEDEAIKAQAIACRTYGVYMIKKGNYDKADISDDFHTHQGYLSKDELKNKWGEKFDVYFNRISSCVEKTKGRIITYNGEVILPAYFALCSGRTENASDVWGGDVPYLKSVASVGDELAAELTSVVKYSEDEFVNCCKKLDGCNVSENMKELVGKIEKTAAGAVKKITIGGKDFSGADIQKAFELKSNNFTVNYENGFFVFTVTGNGHGVGMSQYGADYMARQSSSCGEILKHYYTGIEIV